MNKLKLLGVSALCGSLAAVSAQAGEMSVSGGANATYTTKGGNVTGQPLGMASNLTFAGSGELDNGNTFAVSIAHDDQNGFSTASISVDMAGIGTIAFDQGGGTGLDRLDDKMPTSWEESYDAGLGSNIVTVTGAGGGTDIEWAVDSGFLPDGMSAYFSYAPYAGGGNVNDKAVGGQDAGASATGHGWDIVLEHSGLTDGLNLFAGYSAIEQSGNTEDEKDDKNSWVAGATYAVGGVTVGYQHSEESMGVGAVDVYENDAYGISYSVNDDLSISYGSHESDQSKDVPGSVTLETTSIQAAYTMGGASFKIARSDVSNGSYSTSTANDYDVNTVMLSLAF
jgi:outer membrane protein OmpU